jgi:NAD(P)-dependent dehydrogenase (short-subunit alcohol dehydrogenase family)
MLQDKIVLVTGAGQGIGRATAQAMADYGATVVLVDVQQDRGEQTRQAITDRGGAAKFVACDVTDGPAMEQLVKEIETEFGSLDCAVNNAGTEGVIASTEDYPLEGFDRVLALNLRGVFTCMQAELRSMLVHGGGSIVNIASIAGFAGFANFSAYNATKHAVVGLTRTAALESATRGVRVNAVAPGFIVTPMVTDRGLRAQPGSDDYRMLEEIHPMKRLGQPEEIAEAVAWLCSDRASFVTGHALAVDGGYLAQ